MSDHGMERLVFQCFYIGIGLLLLWWLIMLLLPFLVAGAIGFLVYDIFIRKEER